MLSKSSVRKDPGLRTRDPEPAAPFRDDPAEFHDNAATSEQSIRWRWPESCAHQRKTWGVTVSAATGYGGGAGEIRTREPSYPGYGISSAAPSTGLGDRSAASRFYPLVC